jgi:hypothetical protein
LVYAYLNVTPIYNVGQDLLYKATFGLGPNTDIYMLNFYSFLNNAGTRVHVIGRDEPNQFLLVVVEPEGQVGWIPMNQTTLQAWETEGLTVIQQQDIPAYHRVIMPSSN